MYTKCGHCGAVIVDPGTEFTCPKCGTRIQSRADFMEKFEEAQEVTPSMQYGEMTPFKFFKAIVSGGCLLSVITYILILSMMVAVFLYAIPTVGAHWAEIQALPFIIVPYPVALVQLEGYAAAAYWVFLVVAFFMALVWFIWPERHKLKDLVYDTLPFVRAPSRSNKTTFVIVAQMFFAILFFDTVYYFFIETGGAAPSTPDFPPELWRNLFEFLNASVWEEIAARILLIGAPFLVILLIKSLGDGTFNEKTQDPNKAFRRVLRILAGGHGEFTPITVGLIVFSALMFGFAHAPGWDLWKVVPTAISGLGFGYIYVKKGVHGAILLHFSFDYLGMAEQFLPSNSSTDAALTLIIILWALAGLVYFIYYGAKMIRFFAEPDEGWERPLPMSTERKFWDLLGWN
jgi:hypothetical protein